MDLLKNLFGTGIEYNDWDKESALPMYIADSYQFQLAIIQGIKCIMITPKQELETVPALKKQIIKVKEVENLPVILNLASLSFYRKQNMIENKIPFLTKKQVYLPFMAAYLTDEEETQIEVTKFMVSAQQLALLYLYSEEEKLYLSVATRKLPYTAMSLSRAARQLEATGLFNVTKDGVNKVIGSKYKGRELFEKLKGYLSTPVSQTGYIEKKYITENMALSGETALAEETMLNPLRVKTYAVYAKGFDKNLMMNELVDPDKQVGLQLWGYEPRSLQKTTWQTNYLWYYHLWIAKMRESRGLSRSY